MMNVVLMYTARPSVQLSGETYHLVDLNPLFHGENPRDDRKPV